MLVMTLVVSLALAVSGVHAGSCGHHSPVGALGHSDHDDTGRHDTAAPSAAEIATSHDQMPPSEDGAAGAVEAGLCCCAACHVHAIFNPGTYTQGVALRGVVVPSRTTALADVVPNPVERPPIAAAGV